MRQSPPKVIIRYPVHREDPALYSPKLIHSGYVVGEPVTYTEQPQLPLNYQSFSPKRQRAITSVPLNQSVRYSGDIVYEAPNPVIFAPPLRQSARWSASHRGENVALEEYHSLRLKYGDLERRYQLLEENYERVTAEARGMYSK